MFRIRERYQAVRGELLDIAEECETAPNAGTAAVQLARLCRILVRVIDALP